MKATSTAAEQFAEKLGCDEVSGSAGLQASVQALYLLLGVGFSRRHLRCGTGVSATWKANNVKLRYGSTRL
jgi:hypothetical protein